MAAIIISGQGGNVGSLYVEERNSTTRKKVVLYKAIIKYFDIGLRQYYFLLFRS